MASICASCLFAAPRQFLICCASWPALARRRPAPGPACSFKKRARRRLKAWMCACAPNVFRTARLGICRHKAEWATAGTLPGSTNTITSPWYTRRIFANRLRGTKFGPLNLRFWKIPKKWLVICTFFGEEKKIEISDPWGSKLS